MEWFACLSTCLLALVLPVALAAFLIVKKKGLSISILAGALTFFVSQILLRIPLIQIVLPQFDWFLLMPVVSPWLYAAFLGISAAVFEEGGRYVVIRFCLNKHRTWMDGIAFGIGHGWIEAILIVGINACFMLFTNTFPAGADLLFLAGWERLCTMAAHIAWSVMILSSLNRNKIGGLLVAILLHATLDCMAVLLQASPVWLIEGIITLYAVGSIIYLWKTWKKEKQL